MESSSGRFCGNCEHRHLSTAAVTWCPDCDEAFCLECVDYHDSLKLTKFHKPILLTEFDKLPSYIKNTSIYCTDHDQKCELYCCKHRQCCCNVCLKESHFQCQKLDIIQDAVKNVKTSPALEDIENDLKCLMLNLDSLIKNRQENKTRINAQKLAFMDEIKRLRELFNTELDEMEQSLRDTLASDVEKLDSDLDILVQELEVHKSRINTLQEELKTAISIATDLQVFLGLKPLELKVEEELSYFETLTTNAAICEVDIVLDVPPTVTAISESSKLLGEISQSRKRNDLEFEVRKKEQAQLLLPSVNELSNIKFSEIASFQLPQGDNGINILGCTILPEGLLVFADDRNNRLITCDSVSNFQREIDLSFSPRAVTYINNSNVGVTCQSSSMVAVVELVTGKTLSTFSTVDPCYGISFLNDTLAIRISGFFLLTTIHGTVKAKLKAIGSTHCCAGEDNIFSSSSSSHKVLCFNKDGDLIWHFQDSKLQTPKDVVVDENGFLLAVGESSKNCFAISPDGKTGREIISNLDNPYSLDFDKTSKLMVITNKNGFVRVYHKH